MNRKYTLRTVALLLLSLILLLAGCVEYQPAVTPSGRPSDSGESKPPVVTDEEGNVDEDPFTVTLTVDGKVYIPSEEQPISVQWNDGYSIHTASIGADGVARIGGLDGDYRIRLTAVPEGYAYNPNAYVATNNDRNLEIPLYKIAKKVASWFVRL